MTILRLQCVVGRMILQRWRPILLATVMWSVGGCAAMPTPPAPETPALPASTQAGDTTVVAIGPPAAPCCKQTLPEFLGITGLVKLTCEGLNRIRNRLGMVFPGLEPGPPVLAITDPANSGPNQPPAVQSAAEIKAEEDAAPQKVKAIRFLAGIGCAGCYPNVEESLLAALDDCTEVVRYEAVKAFRTAAGTPCQVCRSGSCCSPAVLKRLNSLAYDTTDSGCYKEPSPRVRRIARLAMNACGGAVFADDMIPDEGPAEEPGMGGDLPPDGMASADGQTLMFSSALAQLRSDASLPVSSPAVAAAEGAVAASVNGEPIFWSEVLARVASDSMMASADDTPTQVALRNDYLRNELYRVIDNRLLSQEARRQMPPDEIARVVYQAGPDGDAGEFVSGIVASATHHDEMLASEWGKRCVYVSPELSRSEMYDYYRANFERYREPGTVRWEQLSARFDRFASPEQAERTLNYVRATILGGQPDWPHDMNLDAIETVSHEATSVAGLPDGVLGRALTMIPEGQTSPILHGTDGLHIVRVLQRSEPRPRSLDEAIDEVRNDMLSQRHSGAIQDHLQRLRREANVWIAPAVEAVPPPVHAAAPAASRMLPPTEETSPSSHQQVQVPPEPMDRAPTATRQIVIPQPSCNCR